MKWSAPIQQVTRGRKGLTSQSASRSSLSLPSSKVGSVLLSRTALTPDPGLWPQGLPPFNSFLFTCPGSLAANLTYTLQLDGHRTRSRGLFPGGRHELNGNTAVTLAKFCLEYWFHFPVCIQDLISPISVSLNFSLLEEGGTPRDHRMVRRDQLGKLIGNRGEQKFSLARLYYIEVWF